MLWVGLNGRIMPMKKGYVFLVGRLEKVLGLVLGLSMLALGYKSCRLGGG